jgi:tRNA pseudouridine38-40 synthase
MQAAADVLVGRHDFSAFRAADCERKTTTRTLTRLAVARSGELVTVEVEADAFLKNMVRIIVGTLCEVGWGKRTPDDVQTILDGGDRRRAGITAPAQGLALVRVDY